MTSTEYFFRKQLTSVRAADRSTIHGPYNNGPTNDGVGATIAIEEPQLVVDGITMRNQDRVCLAHQPLRKENGIYDVSGVGTSVVLTRADDMQHGSQVRAGQYFYTESGQNNAGVVFTVVEPVPEKVGFDMINIVAPGHELNSEIKTSDLDVINFSDLSGGQEVVLLDVLPNESYIIQDMWLNFTTTNLNVGDRNVDITDGTTVYGQVTAATIGVGWANTRWGDTGLVFLYPPAPASLATPTVPGQDIVVRYSGGSSDYTGGDISFAAITRRRL